MSLLTGGGLLSLCSKCTRSLSRLSLSPQLQMTRHYQWKKQTHYDILGVHPEATQAEIKAAYLKLSKVLACHFQNVLRFLSKNVSGASS